MQINKEVLHVSDAASLLCVSSQKIYEMIRKGELAAYKDGKAWKIHVASIESYVHLRLSK